MSSKRRVFSDHLKPINVLLVAMCICPFVSGKKPWKTENTVFYGAYYLSTWLVHETLFIYTWPLKLSYKAHMSFSEAAILISWIVMARSFAVVVLISFLNLENQKALFLRIDELDEKLASKLNIRPAYKGLTNELSLSALFVIVFHYTAYISQGIYYQDNWATMVFYFTCNHADIYFGLCVVYTIFWGKIYRLHLFTIINSLDMLTFISKKSLERILETLRLIFDIQELIEKSFGSIMFLTMTLYSFTIAVAVYVCIHTCYVNGKNIWTDLFIYSLWLLPLVVKLWYSVHTYSFSGRLVSRL